MVMFGTKLVPEKLSSKLAEDKLAKLALPWQGGSAEFIGLIPAPKYIHFGLSNIGASSKAILLEFKPQAPDKYKNPSL